MNAWGDSVSPIRPRCVRGLAAATQLLRPSPNEQFSVCSRRVGPKPGNGRLLRYWAVAAALDAAPGLLAISAITSETTASGSCGSSVAQ
jgi:hypothetical protein